MSDYVCHGCWPEAIEIGELSPGYGIVLDLGYFHIVRGDHKEDIIVTFENTPNKDPNPGNLNQSPDAIAAKQEWLRQVKRETDGKLNFPLDKGHHFIQSLIDEGWNREKETYVMFLYNRVGMLIEEKLSELTDLPVKKADN